jgi:hypothetical protein
MRLCLGVFLIFCLTAIAKDRCNCRQTPPDESTHWGGNLGVVYQETKTYKTIQGVVLDMDEPFPGVLVEIFDEPDYLLFGYPQYQELQKKQHRIAACKTREDGRFCFPNISKGKYEIRASFDSGFDVTHVWVQIDPRNSQAKKADMKIPIWVGT